MSRVRPLVHSNDAERQTWHALLLPSTLSGFIAVTAALFFVVFIMVGSQLKGSSVQQLYQSETITAYSSIATIYHETSQKYADNRLVSSAPLFVFWACLGLLVYGFATNVVAAFRNVADLGVEMEYANIDRRALLMTALERVVTRVMAAALLFVYARFTLHIVVPYVGALSHLALRSGEIVMDVVYFIWAIAAGAVCLHVGTILIRLFALKARIFASA